MAFLRFSNGTFLLAQLTIPEPTLQLFLVQAAAFPGHTRPILPYEIPHFLQDYPSVSSEDSPHFVERALPLFDPPPVPATLGVLRGKMTQVLLVSSCQRGKAPPDTPKLLGASLLAPETTEAKKRKQVSLPGEKLVLFGLNHSWQLELSSSLPNLNHSKLILTGNASCYRC